MTPRITPGDDTEIDPLVAATLAALSALEAADEAPVSIARLRKRLDTHQSVLSRILTALADAELVELIETEAGAIKVKLSPSGLELAHAICARPRGAAR
jgi:DNA-binding IscR family transcriptional regulator